MLSPKLHRRADARTMLTLCIAGAAFAASNVNAQSDLPSEPVRISDLDLSTDRGRARLDRRIRTAAQKLCSGLTISPGPRTNYGCVKKAVASAAEARLAAIEAATTLRSRELATDLKYIGPIDRLPLGREGLLRTEGDAVDVN